MAKRKLKEENPNNMENKDEINSITDHIEMDLTDKLLEYYNTSIQENKHLIGNHNVLE